MQTTETRVIPNCHEIFVSGVLGMCIALGADSSYTEDPNASDWQQVQEYRETGWSDVSSFVDPRFPASVIAWAWLSSELTVDRF